MHLAFQPLLQRQFGNSMLESIIPFKDIESHVQFPCASHSYSSNSMLGKNDTEVAAIVPVYYTLYLISIDDGMWMMGIRWLGDGVSW